MPNFNLTLKSEHSDSFRVSKVKADFDLSANEIIEHFSGEIVYPDEWQIGVIVGPSGSGKSSIAKNIFGDDCICSQSFGSKSVIDDIDPNVSIDDIEKMFASVGFGSVPSWLKPYSVLSNGEKMRVELAKALLEKNFIVFDEFTSVVDRNVAKTSCIAVEKAIRRNKKKKVILISCHYDILEWLKPDWVYDTARNKSFFGQTLVHKENTELESVSEGNGKDLVVITI